MTTRSMRTNMHECGGTILSARLDGDGYDYCDSCGAFAFDGPRRERDMTVLELFAGAGGAALGLKAAGLTSVGLVERNTNACATLRQAGLGPVLEGDVRELAQAPAAEVWWASPPCQPFSSANKHRKGAADDRNGWPWVCALFDRTPKADRPTWLIAENVPGMVRGKLRRWFDTVLLPMLRARFVQVQWRILRASDYGVPQHRDRVIIIAGPHPVSWPRATHGDPQKLGAMCDSRKPWVTCGEALGIAPPNHDRKRPITGEPANTVLERPDWWRRITETTTPARTVGTRGNAAVRGERGERRQLTVEECAILQGFPPGHPFQGNKTSQYQQVGNAVPPRLAEVVARAVVAA